MSATQPSIELHTGAKMPSMAFGTLLETITPELDYAVSVMENALEAGYRHLDTATIYGTEQAVGVAVSNKTNAGLINRKDVFITTKLWRTAARHQDVVPALQQSLQRLDMSHVDLFLIHWSTAFQSSTETLFPKDEGGNLIYADTDYLETWKGMEECVDLGLAKAIGVSNFNSKQIQRILDNCRIKPATNQVESHPFLTNKKLIEFCQDRGIPVLAYAPLAGFNAQYREEQGWPTIFTDETMMGIAKRHNCTPAQVALQYQLQRGVGVAPKSSKRHRMEENFNAMSLKLCDDAMKAIDGLDRTMRLNAEFPDHPRYPFHEEY